MILTAKSLFRITRPLRLFAFTVAASLLAGCANPTQPIITAGSGMAHASYAFAPHFEMSGRISVRVNDRLDSGQLRWTRASGEERIGLYSPLGGQVAEATRLGTGPAKLRRDGVYHEASTLDELAKELLGVAIGVDRIAAWVQGVGLEEGIEVEVETQKGELWRVRADRFQLAAPFRFAARLSAQRGDVSVRLVIDEWRAL